MLSGLLSLADGHADITGATAQVQQTRGRATQAASAWLPTIQGSGSWQTGTPGAAFRSETNSIDQFTSSLDLSLPLNPWKAVPTQQAARSDREAAEQQLGAVRADVVLMVVEAWLDSLEARADRALVLRQLDAARELLAVTEARYAGGDLGGVEVLQQRQQLAVTRAELPTAQATVERSDRALAALLRISADGLPTLPDTLPEASRLPVPSPPELILADPGVRAAHAEWEAARSRRQAAAARFAPNLAFSAGTGVRFTEGVDTDATPTWSAGLGLTVPIFDGGSTVGAVQEARGAERQALSQLEQAVLDLVRAVEDARTRWDETTARRGFADQAQDLAEDAFTAALAAYAAGTSTYNTVLTAAQTSFSAAQTALQARRDQLDAGLDLLAATRSTWVMELP